MKLDFERLFAPSRVRHNGFPRMPLIAEGGMVAASHPLAGQAGLRMLEHGGNAIDAALAAAAVMTIAEPTENGPGGDAMAIIWHGGQLHGLNGSGSSPGELAGQDFERFGPRSITVPGAVRAWSDLAERFGRLGLDRCIQPAIDLAEKGIACSARAAARWRIAELEWRAPRPAPSAGAPYRLPELAGTLRRIAIEGPAALYRGPIAQAISAHSWLSEADLEAHRSEWVEPLRLRLGEVEVSELPPNCSGAAALVALAVGQRAHSGDELERLHIEIEATKLALADARGFSDAPLPDGLLAAARLERMRAGITQGQAAPSALSTPSGDTTYLCCVDSERNAISLIQSLYLKFGSGVAAGDTGVVLHNRAACFSAEPGHPNRLEPGKRPYHAIMPGFLLENGRLLGPFGVMGGMMQPQGHLQVVSQLLEAGADPQAALDAARFRVGDGGDVALEPGLAHQAEALRALGHRVTVAEDPGDFGVGQMILDLGEALVGGADGRGDGTIAVC
jgi:gamma-glutamyltranspeptidase/glutathione hydrolase